MSLTLNEHMENGERPLAARLLDMLKRKEEQLAMAVEGLETIADTPAEPTAASIAEDYLCIIRNISSDNQQTK